MSEPIPSLVIQAAQSAMRQTRVPASVTLAQWIQESGRGVHTPPDSNNPFGIKEFHGGPRVMAMTTEVVNGIKKRVLQPFKKFPTLDDAFTYHAHLIATDSRYAKAMAIVTNPLLFVQALGPVYATDEDYADEVEKLIIQDRLLQYDV